MVQQHAPVMTFVSVLGDFFMQQPCLSAGFTASMDDADVTAFIGHPVPDVDVRHAATRSAGRSKPVNIVNAAKSSGSVRRDIVVSTLRYHGGG